MFLTERQQDVLQFVRDFIQDRGISPTLEEMAQYFGVSRVTVYEHVKALVEKGREAVRAWCEAKGCYVAHQPTDRSQAVQVRLLQAFLRATKDPDAAALDSYAEGIRFGLGVQMQRTPAVFEEKKKWSMDFEDSEMSEAWEPNYRSATSHPEWGWGEP